MKNFKTKMALLLGATLIAGSSLTVSAQEKPLIARNNTVVVCRSKQCKMASSMMTQEFLYNKLASLLKNNVNQKVLFCDADPNVRVCLNDAITFKAEVGATQSTVEIPSALVVDTKSMKDDKTQKFVLDYNMTVGDTYPECQGSLNKLLISSADDISIEAPGFECRFTENGMTVVNASYEVDYIDFDYGIIGAYYTLAVGQVSKGGNSGYALLRFQRTANPNNEVMDSCGCACDEKQEPPCSCKKEEPEVIVQEKVVTQYEVAPIEVYVKTKAPIQAGQLQDIKVNGVTVQNVPVVSEAPVPVAALEKTTAGEVVQSSVPAPAAQEVPSTVSDTQILKAGVPVIKEVIEDVAVGEVRASSNWDK